VSAERCVLRNNYTSWWLVVAVGLARLCPTPVERASEKRDPHYSRRHFHRRAHAREQGVGAGARTPALAQPAQVP
jgi:hypothetical protein